MKFIYSNKNVVGKSNYLNLPYVKDSTQQWIIDNFTTGLDFLKSEELTPIFVDDFNIKVVFNDVQLGDRDGKEVNYFIGDLPIVNNGLCSFGFVQSSKTFRNGKHVNCQYTLSMDLGAMYVNEFESKFNGKVMFSRLHIKDGKKGNIENSLIPNYKSENSLCGCDSYCEKKNTLYTNDVKPLYDKPGDSIKPFQMLGFSRFQLPIDIPNDGSGIYRGGMSFLTLSSTIFEYLKEDESIINAIEMPYLTIFTNTTMNKSEGGTAQDIINNFTYMAKDYSNDLSSPESAWGYKGIGDNGHVGELFYTEKMGYEKPKDTSYAGGSPAYGFCPYGYKIENVQLVGLFEEIKSSIFEIDTAGIGHSYEPITKELDPTPIDPRDMNTIMEVYYPLSLTEEEKQDKDKIDAKMHKNMKLKIPTIKKEGIELFNLKIEDIVNEKENYISPHTYMSNHFQWQIQSFMSTKIVLDGKTLFGNSDLTKISTNIVYEFSPNESGFKIYILNTDIGDKFNIYEEKYVLNSVKNNIMPFSNDTYNDGMRANINSIMTGKENATLQYNTEKTKLTATTLFDFVSKIGMMGAGIALMGTGVGGAMGMGLLIGGGASLLNESTSGMGELIANVAQAQNTRDMTYNAINAKMDDASQSDSNVRVLDNSIMTSLGKQSMNQNLIFEPYVFTMKNSDYDINQINFYRNVFGCQYDNVKNVDSLNSLLVKKYGTYMKLSDSTPIIDRMNIPREVKNLFITIFNGGVHVGNANILDPDMILDYNKNNYDKGLDSITPSGERFTYGFGAKFGFGGKN